jgi:hypothetical protein
MRNRDARNREFRACKRGRRSARLRRAAPSPLG